MPPGAISPSIMFSMVRPPPNEVYEEWNEFTAPVEVSVVAAPKVAEFSTPKRVSVPSVAAPAAAGTVLPPPRPLLRFSRTMLASAMMLIAARIA